MVPLIFHGSGDFSAASDVIWTWTRPLDASRPGIIEIEGRLPPVDAIAVHLSPDECTYLGIRSSDAKREEEEQRILRHAYERWIKGKGHRHKGGYSLLYGHKASRLSTTARLG